VPPTATVQLPADAQGSTGEIDIRPADSQDLATPEPRRQRQAVEILDVLGTQPVQPVTANRRHDVQSNVDLIAAEG
jgi:hypothetical protein